MLPGPVCLSNNRKSLCSCSAFVYPCLSDSNSLPCQEQKGRTLDRHLQAPQSRGVPKEGPEEGNESWLSGVWGPCPDLQPWSQPAA